MRLVPRRRRPAGPATAPERPRPVDLARVEAWLRGQGYHVVQDADGDLTGTWDGDRFWFLLLGDEDQGLQVRGRWQRTLPPSRRSAALLAMNDWNRERIWPKVYLREEDGRLAVYTEVSVDLSAGATDDQLAQLLSCGLGTGAQFFAALRGLVPPDDDV